MGIRHRVVAALCGAVLLAAPAATAAVTVETGLIGAANAVEWPFYIGIDKGFFAAAGIKLDIIYVSTASGLVQQLAAHSLDIVDIGVVEPIHAVARGAPVAIIRISGAVSPYEIVAKPAITTIAALKRHTVVGNTAGCFAALKSGAADATMLAPPVNFFAEEAGFRKIGFFPTGNVISRRRLEAPMDEMTAIGDTNGKVPIDKPVFPGIARVTD